MDNLSQQSYQKKYFHNGLRDILADEYFCVGIMVVIALFQNGQLPVYMPETQFSQSLDPMIHPLVF